MWYAIHFKFLSPLHLSNARADYGKSERLLHSDSLIAALMSIWAQGGQLDWIEEAKTDLLNGELALSSALVNYGSPC